MEKFRVVYHNAEGEASEAVVEGEEGHEAAKSIEDLGVLHTIESLGPSGPDYDEVQPDKEVNEGDADPLTLGEVPEELPYKDGEGGPDS